MTRDELLTEILANDILPMGTAAEMAAATAMGTEELRAAVEAWIQAGDECGYENMTVVS